MNVESSNSSIEYRKYRVSDYESYAAFCTNNFGKNNYQLNRSYLEWLYDEPGNSFLVAVSDNEIVGIMHNFKAPVVINDEYKIVTVLHDLMVDDKYQGGAGFHLMQNGLKSDEYVVLPGALGRISRAYSRLGSKSFDSFWYRKFQLPRSFFSSTKIKGLTKYKDLASKQDLLFGHNKEESNEFLARALKKYHSSDLFSGYFKWRFSSKNAPLTFYVADPEGQNTVLFVIGKRGLSPYVRIFYTHSDNELLLNNILKFIETITSKIGIPIILFTTFECLPPAKLRYKMYADVPISYVYSKNKNHDFVPKVPTFCSDIGFDGLNPF